MHVIWLLRSYMLLSDAHRFRRHLRVITRRGRILLFIQCIVNIKTHFTLSYAFIISRTIMTVFIQVVWSAGYQFFIFHNTPIRYCFLLFARRHASSCYQHVNWPFAVILLFLCYVIFYTNLNLLTISISLYSIYLNSIRM